MRPGKASPRIAPYRGRLAPSPTGALHLGNARSFLIAWLRARHNGGRLVLRMEDLDHPRHKPEAKEQALADLRWLGLDWDEGPDIGGRAAPYTQSRCLDHYRLAIEKLFALGLVYPCVCSRKDVAAGQSAPHRDDFTVPYNGACRERFPGQTAGQCYAAAKACLPAGRLPAWRFRALAGPVELFDLFHGRQDMRDGRERGDFVLARHPEGAGYMLAVVVDDARMGISEVVRGDDLLPVTGQQLQLYRALGLSPPAFLHLPLVVGEDGRRLAKRHGDTRLARYREQGVAPEKIVGLLAWWCGWAKLGEWLRPADLLGRFDLSHLPERPVVMTAETENYLASPPGRRIIAPSRAGSLR